jgi:glycosyltransferase involved in cell wall biosynthesis
MSVLTEKIVAVSHACVKQINRAIYRKLSENRWDIHLVVPKKLQDAHLPFDAEAKTPDDPPIEFMELAGKNPRTYLYRGLEHFLEEKQPDIVFLECDPVSRLAVRVGKQGRVSSRPFKTVCLSCENLDFRFVSSFRRTGVKGIPSTIAKLWLARQAVKVLDHVFTINKEGTRLFTDLGFESVSQIPLGFDPCYFHVDTATRTATRDRLGISTVAVAYFGRIVPEKGIDHLIQSLARLKDLKWTLVLDQFAHIQSDYAWELKTLIQKCAIEDRVVYIKPDHGEIANYMNAVDIVVLPSLSTAKWKEQYGRVAPESMACGRMVIAYDSGALGELIGKAGVLVEEGNTEELAKALRSAIMNEDIRSSYGERAALRASTHLSVAAQATAMQKVFARFYGS